MVLVVRMAMRIDHGRNDRHYSSNTSPRGTVLTNFPHWCLFLFAWHGGGDRLGWAEGASLALAVLAVIPRLRALAELTARLVPVVAWQRRVAKLSLRLHRGSNRRLACCERAACQQCGRKQRSLHGLSA